MGSTITDISIAFVVVVKPNNFSRGGKTNDDVLNLPPRGTDVLAEGC